MLFTLLSSPILRLCGATDETYALACGYSRWVISVGGTFSILNTVLANLIRADGSAFAASMGVSAGSIIIVLGVSTLFGRILTMQRIPHQLANAMITLTDNPYVILVLIGLLLLFLGMFMETLATIVILAPIFLPLITKVGIDPVFFGIFWVITNEVALLSPPLGVNLFIAQNLSGISFERVAKGAFPYMMLIICFIIMLILWQDLPLWLPRLTGQY